MNGQDRSLSFGSLIKGQTFSDQTVPFFYGGLFLDDQRVPASFVSLIFKNGDCGGSGFGLSKTVRLVKRRQGGGGFLSVSLSVKGSEGGYVGESSESWGQNGNGECKSAEAEVHEKKKEKELGAFNTTKHLLAGAVAAAVSRFCF